MKTILIAWLLAHGVCAAEELPMHIYILMGQSNMAGRGKPTGKEEPHPRIVVLNKDGAWEPAKDPLHWDKPSRVGVGPGMSFARELVRQDERIRVGLVPCAVGGTSLCQWFKGATLYENAVARARQAAKVGALKGMLWHQGESGVGGGLGAEVYAAKLAEMIRSFRQDVDVAELPVLVGKLGDFVGDGAAINAQIEQVPKLVPHTAVVSATGLKDQGDKLHFDVAAQQEFGVRYAAALLKLK